jgi:hypothetical protein
MLRRMGVGLAVAALLLAVSGCPSGSHRAFEHYGIYYGVAPEGYIAAQYQVATSERARVTKVDAFRAAASELAGVLDGSLPLRNGTTSDLRNVRTITIVLLFVDYSRPADQCDEVFGVAAFPVEKIVEVARFGPTAEMAINDRTVWSQKVEVIAAREHRRLMSDDGVDGP